MMQQEELIRAAAFRSASYFTRIVCDYCVDRYSSSGTLNGDHNYVDTNCTAYTFNPSTYLGRLKAYRPLPSRLLGFA
jgi:hypothetical protein